MAHGHQLASPSLSDLSTSDDERGLSSNTLNAPSGTPPRFQRQLGDCEASYFLPSRENGVNDMYLHLGFRAPEHLVRRERVRAVWAILLGRHPLLSAKVEMHDYEDIRFVYSPAQSLSEALLRAEESLKFGSFTKDELLESYLNGPRTLSNERLAYLFISQSNAQEPLSPPLTPDPNTGAQLGDPRLSQFEYFLCAAHFLGDGMALHQFSNDFFCLLGGALSTSELESLLAEEHQKRLEGGTNDAAALPNALEDNLLIPPGRFRRAVGKVDFERLKTKQIGGHTFPRKASATRHTIVPTISFDATRTGKILNACRAHGVSISAALFAVCNIAWARSSRDNWTMPTMMYSALNLRPYFNVKPKNQSYWFLAIGYFNVILPAFLPSGDVSGTFWHRARLAKQQSLKAARNSMVISRSLAMAHERGERARVWAKEDDDKANGVFRPVPKPAPAAQTPQVPSSVLLGLSLLGNLDGVYKHALFPDIQMHTLTTGSRQRAGGMLIFGYTFAGKLWVSLGYDENGFEKEVLRKFWDNVLHAIDELLV